MGAWCANRGRPSARLRRVELPPGVLKHRRCQPRLGEKLGFYVELFNSVSNERHSAWIATFDFGFTYAVTRDIQLDAGMNIGLTDAADDFNPFIGLSMRY